MWRCVQFSILEMTFRVKPQSMSFVAPSSAVEMSASSSAGGEGYGMSLLIGIVVSMYAIVGILFVWFISNPANIQKMKKRWWVIYLSVDYRPHFVPIIIPGPSRERRKLLKELRRRHYQHRKYFANDSEEEMETEESKTFEGPAEGDIDQYSHQPKPDVEKKTD